MRALARGRGGDGEHVIDVLDKQPQRLRTLQTLTGGNPRILTLIYRLPEAGQSEAAMADPEILLDQVTPYYKARVEEYQTPQQRAVIDAIALHWDPITTGDLARVTNIATTTLSPLLIRLRKDGLIETVETSGSYAGHRLVERFFNPKRPGFTHGCPLTTLGADVARRGASKEAIGGALADMLDALTRTLPGRKRQNSLTALSTMVGAVVLSRLAADPKQAEAFLAAAAASILPASILPASILPASILPASILPAGKTINRSASMDERQPE